MVFDAPGIDLLESQNVFLEPYLLVDLNASNLQSEAAEAEPDGVDDPAVSSAA